MSFSLLLTSEPLDAFPALPACPGRLRHGHLGVHARRPSAGHRLRPRCHSRGSGHAHLGLRGRNGRRCPSHGRIHPQLARTIQPARIRRPVRDRPRRRRLHLELHPPVRDPGVRRDRERGVPRRGSDDCRHARPARQEGTRARRAAGRHDCGHDRRSPRRITARHTAGLASHVLGRRRALPARSARHHHRCPRAPSAPGRGPRTGLAIGARTTEAIRGCCWSCCWGRW